MDTMDKLTVNEKDSEPNPFQNPPLSQLLQQQMKDPLVQAFVEQLSDIQKVGLNVSIKILPMTNIKKCNGFIKWKKENGL
jgi:hypothetical protein|tara:strand:- start:1345 stop:1584 length:240 start_codon:yes stop_codon:yes gene_type:complete